MDNTIERNCKFYITDVKCDALKQISCTNCNFFKAKPYSEPPSNHDQTIIVKAAKEPKVKKPQKIRTEGPYKKTVYKSYNKPFNKEK